MKTDILKENRLILFENKIHRNGRSYEVLIIKNKPLVDGIKLKMTYESYNAVEKFTGELFVNGIWEFFFSMMDLGVEPNSSNYIRDDEFRKQRCNELQKLGVEFFKIIV
jgi:hypothetical protein